jgi:2-hydroxy-3-keto-5-methylthiopentenyl-1-phosphate phosphatase
MVILCDFDDTAADRNVATLLLDAFPKGPFTQTSPRWRDLHSQYLNAEITLAEYQEHAFTGMPASRERQAAYAREHASLRPGFRELAGYCAVNDIELAIVSHGLDFYVEAVLEAADLGHLPIFAVETSDSEAGGTTFAYPFARDECAWAPGNCKCSIVEEYRERGHRVLYAGDGLSDTCPAKQADFVFARDGLLHFCEAHDLPHRELTDFNVILDYLEEVGPEGA